MNAVDNTAAEFGTATFASLSVVLKLITAYVEADEVQAAKVPPLQSRIDQCEQFLRSEFCEHLQENSYVTNHCLQHALGSDVSYLEYRTECFRPKPPKRGYAAECAHEHTHFCKECEEPHMLVDAIAALLDSAQGISADERMMIEDELCHLRKKLQHYIAHLVRGTWEAKQYAQALGSLVPGVLLVVGDFKMKWRPTSHSESHGEWFAKTGFPWHGLKLVWMSRNREIHYYYVNHISQDGIEDHMFVLCSIAEAIKELIINKTDPPIEEVKGFFDNANCYKGQDLIYGWAKLTEHLAYFFSEVANTVVPRFTHLFIAEAGFGKTDLDGHFGRITMLLRLQINKGPEFDATDAVRLVSVLNCISAAGVVNRLLVIDRELHFQLSASTFYQIGSMAHRWVEYETDDEGAQVPVAICMERSSHLTDSMPVKYPMRDVDGRALLSDRYHQYSLQEYGFGGELIHVPKADAPGEDGGGAAAGIALVDHKALPTENPTVSPLAPTPPPPPMCVYI